MKYKEQEDFVKDPSGVVSVVVIVVPTSYMSVSVLSTTAVVLVVDGAFFCTCRRCVIHQRTAG